MGDSSIAANCWSKTNYANVEGLTRHSEAARASERRASTGASGSRQRAASPRFGLRELQTGDRCSADAVCISGNQRGYRKTSSRENGGRSRGSSVDGSTSESPLARYRAQQHQVCGQDADEIHKGKDSFHTRESTSISNSAVLPIVGVSSLFCPGARSGRACPHTQSGQGCYNNSYEGSQAGCSKDRVSDRCTCERCDSKSTTCRVQQRCKKRSEHASTSNGIDPSFQPVITLPRDDVQWDREHTCHRKTCRGHAEPRSAHTEDTFPMASMDGPSEVETKAQQQLTVERRVSQVPSGQVAARIRSLELMNAIPMPQHFQPAGHTRHAQVHRKHRHVDDEPAVELIFPLHVRRFPWRTSTGSPCRPESPIHRSIPQGEPYIHSPQPARSMPMLKDPPDPEPQPETRSPGTSPTNQEDPVINSGSVARESENILTRRKSLP